MIAEFIGHGLHEDDNETCGNYICSSFKSEVFTDITVFVAFIRRPGILELKPFIEKAIAEKRKVTFYVGRNDFITSKEALELLLELKVETYIYFTESIIYHPKVYLFEGAKNRIIAGSSNLTKTGLFYNVECSLLLDFSNQDSAGMKVLNQLKDYFSPLLDFTDPNLEYVTKEHIEKLYTDGLIPTEEFDYDINYLPKPKSTSGRKTKLPAIGELGTIEVTEDKPRKKYKNDTLAITEAYLQKWDYMFERMKAYKAENPNKLDWRTRFFKHINKKEKLDDKTIKDIEFAWKYHFHEKPHWGKMHTGTVDRTDEWKEYRKATGQWFPIKLTNGEPIALHHWVKNKRKSLKQMKRIIDKFTEQEQEELYFAGFPIFDDQEAQTHNIGIANSGA